jgi:hypothetical protein
MVTPTAIDVALAAMATAISTLQAATTASGECAVGAVTAASALAGTAARPHPPTSVSTPVDTVADAIIGHPPAGLPFLTAGASAPAGPLDAVDAPACTAASATGP